MNKYKNVRRGLILAGALLVIITGFFALTIALSPQDELAQLENELTSSGYSWLVDYSVEPSSANIEVYEKDGNVSIATFENVNEDKKYKVFLTNLVGEQDVFDLLIPYEIMQRKARLDEIRKELNQKGGFK